MIDKEKLLEFLKSKHQTHDDIWSYGYNEALKDIEEFIKTNAKNRI